MKRLRLDKRAVEPRRNIDEEEFLKRLREYCDDYVTVGESYFTEEDRNFEEKEIENDE